MRPFVAGDTHCWKFDVLLRLSALKTPNPSNRGDSLFGLALPERLGERRDQRVLPSGEQLAQRVERPQRRRRLPALVAADRRRRHALDTERCRQPRLEGCLGQPGTLSRLAEQSRQFAPDMGFSGFV